MEACFAHNVPMVIGTTGLAEEEVVRWQRRAEKSTWRALIVPNFAIGAVLMMKFAQQAVSFFLIKWKS